MEVIKETLWKRWLSTPTKTSAKNSNICLSETAYQNKETRKKCKKTNQATIIQWQRQCLMDKPTNHIASPERSRKRATFLTRVPVHCITPFCSDALVSLPNLYPPWVKLRLWSLRSCSVHCRHKGYLCRRPKCTNVQKVITVCPKCNKFISCQLQ